MERGAGHVFVLTYSAGAECGDGRMMEEDCSLRPGATDFSIDAIMARPGRRRNSKREEDASSPGESEPRVPSADKTDSCRVDEILHKEDCDKDMSLNIKLKL